MEITVYVVWTLEDADNVDIFVNDEPAATKLYDEYGEFGMWEEKSFTLHV